MDELQWGRKVNSTFLNEVLSLTLVVVCPLWLATTWITLEHFDASFTSTFKAANTQGYQRFLQQYAPRPDLPSTIGYTMWILFQATLYTFLPGPLSTGQVTPAGHVLKYKTNGLLAWIVTHALAIVAAAFGYLNLNVIADHFEGLLVAAMAYGYLLSLFMTVKGHIAPSYTGDRKLSGSIIFDYFVGIELNPRFGELWDVKLFHNGRPGIVAWTLISLSWTAQQYRRLGYVCNALLIVDLLHMIYVVDFFYNEDWYLRTIDMCHDHYGFYLAWGSVAAVPAIYTIQSQYLSRFPTDLSTSHALAILTLGLSGYFIFRSANHEKDIVRQTDGNCKVWGQPAEVMRLPYVTTDGKKHTGVLLCCGWWSLARHANWSGDLMQAIALGACCGFDKVLPWSYTLFISAIFANRLPRDEKRCERKYGDGWRRYCERVRWRLLPGVF